MPDRDRFQSAADECETLVIKDPVAEAYRRYVQWWIMPDEMKERLGIPVKKIEFARLLWPDANEVSDKGLWQRMKRFEERESFAEDCREEGRKMLQRWEGPMLIQGIEMAMRGDRESYPYWKDLMEEAGLLDDTQHVQVDHTHDVSAVQRMSHQRLEKAVRKDLKRLPRFEGYTEEEMDLVMEGVHAATTLGTVTPSEVQKTEERSKYDGEDWRRDPDDIGREPTV